MAMPPLRVISEATKPTRRMFKSRCSFEKPNSEEDSSRTKSPSSSVTGRPPISRRRTSNVVGQSSTFPNPTIP